MSLSGTDNLGNDVLTILQRAINSIHHLHKNSSKIINYDKCPCISRTVARIELERTMAGINGQPDDAQWEEMDLEVAQSWGDYAVKKQNTLHPGWNLSFKEGCKAWKRFCASDSSHMYRVHLKALKDNVLVKYEAVIWEDSVPLYYPNHNIKLMAFKELSPCAPPQN